jgi:hypothetical protein
MMETITVVTIDRDIMSPAVRLRVFPGEDFVAIAPRVYRWRGIVL